MESIRVDLCYRPLRVAWAISAGDLNGFRNAVRVSHTLWGGRFNPIIIVEQDGAEALVNLFRADVVLAMSDSDSVRLFLKRFPHLIKPFFHDSVFVGDGQYGSPCQILDIQNALEYLHGSPEWSKLRKREFRLYTWKPDDPLADVFLMHLGQYPGLDVVPTDYRQLVKYATEAAELDIEPTSKLPADTFEHPSISFLARSGLKRNYGTRGGWDSPGFYSGDAQKVEDLVCFWNLRAAHVPLLFVDTKHLDRYGDAIPSWEKAMRQFVSRWRDESDRSLAVWARVDGTTNTQEGLKEIMEPFQGRASVACCIPNGALADTGLRPPMMDFGEVSTLGIVGAEFGKVKISFALERKPFDAHAWFHTQHLVASIAFVTDLYGDEQHTLIPPFVPELNEFYARTMRFHYDRLRIEPGRVGLIIDPCDQSTFIYALPVRELVENIFSLAGFSAKLSESGLIARQLIAQLGGVDRARAFKIPGVRRLLKTYGPTTPFTRKSAVQLIASRDQENPEANFKDYENNLYIEPRPRGTKLTPAAVFAFLVEKGLFRIGADLECPNCRLPSWTALDALKQQVICDLCGHIFNATRQLINEDWHYRRSGVLGKERNAQGAIPVVLTLQQFKVNLDGFGSRATYSTSLNLAPRSGFDLPNCEVDFVWLEPRPYPDRAVIIIGECKDRGGDREKGKASGTIDANDIDKLRRVADALPQKRFKTFVVLAKLCPFTPEEIALAKTLNCGHRRRAILLTSRELEPYHFFDRTKLEFKDIREYASSAEDLAIATEAMYFKDAAPS